MEEDSTYAEMPPPATDDLVSGQVDYFGEIDDIKHHLPDGKSWVTLKVFMEGDRRRFQNAVNKDVKISRGSGDMAMRLTPGEERHELLKMAVTGWNLVRGGRPIDFTPRTLQEFLDRGHTAAIDDIERKIRELNPWMGSEMTVEDVDVEISRLQDLRKEIEEKNRSKS